MAHEFHVDGRCFPVAPRYRPGGFELVIDGKALRAELRSTGEGCYELRCQDRLRRIRLHRDGDTVHLHLDGRSLSVRLVDPLERLRSEARRSGAGLALTAPMPGVVVELRRAPGEPVAAGETVLVIESMKLQTAIDAEVAGTVSELPFAVGESFEQGAVLARLANPEEDPS